MHAVTDEKKTTILMVEDSRTQALKLKMLLEEHDYRVLWAEDGLKGLEVAIAEKPDLVISDVEMSVMDGFEMTNVIKHDEKLKSIPVILLTSLSDPEDIIKGLKARADVYVTKPYNAYFLLSKIAFLLSDPVFVRSGVKEVPMELQFKGKEHFFTTPPGKMLTLMLSTYEDSVLKAFELDKTKTALEEMIKRLKEEVDNKEAAEKKLKNLKERLTKHFDIQSATKEVMEKYNQDLEKKVVERTTHLKNELLQKKKTQESLKSTLFQHQGAVEGIIHVMTQVMSYRDPSYAKHMKQVSKLGELLAKKLSRSNRSIMGVKMAALVQNIGYVAIPQNILAKPAPLSAMEFTMVKNHPEVAWNILSPVKFPWPIAEIVYQHHERLNGSGYPRGLARDAILPEARILTVADVVVAMQSHRPHRPAMRLEKAIEELMTYKGVLYDPDVVDACILILQSGGFKMA